MKFEKVNFWIFMDVVGKGGSAGYGSKSEKRLFNFFIYCHFD